MNTSLNLGYKEILEQVSKNNIIFERFSNESVFNRINVTKTLTTGMEKMSNLLQTLVNNSNIEKNVTADQFNFFNKQWNLTRSAVTQVFDLLSAQQHKHKLLFFAVLSLNLLLFSLILISFCGMCIYCCRTACASTAKKRNIDTAPESAQLSAYTKTGSVKSQRTDLVSIELGTEKVKSSEEEIGVEETRV